MKMNNIQLGILELGYRENCNSLACFQQVLDYACKADVLNFSRFWLAEHHNSNVFAPYTNPEIIITLIAALTENIRVGAAGILLGMYEPYHVAMTFKLLDNLYNNRIDLGLAKGLPSNGFIKSYGNNNKPLNFHVKLADLYSYLHYEDKILDEKQVIVPPYRGTLPELWYLTNSYKNSDILVKNKSNLCRSIMHGPQPVRFNYGKDELFMHKKLYLREHGVYPKISLAFAVVIDTTITTAKNKISKLSSKSKLDSSFITAIPCTYNSLQEIIYEFQDKFGIDEFVIYDMEGDNIEKIKNLEKISLMMNF